MPCADRCGAGERDRASRSPRLPRARLSGLVANRCAAGRGWRAERGGGESPSGNSPESGGQLVLSEGRTRGWDELRRAHSGMLARGGGKAGGETLSPAKEGMRGKE